MYAEVKDCAGDVKGNMCRSEGMFARYESESMCVGVQESEKGTVQKLDRTSAEIQKVSSATTVSTRFCNMSTKQHADEKSCFTWN